MVTKYGRFKKFRQEKYLDIFEKFKILREAADGINFKTL